MPSKIAPPPPESGPSAKAAAAPSQQPVKRFRLGRISAAVWENAAENGPLYNVTFRRTYVDDAKNFRDTDHFGRDDLPLVAKLADQAHSFIFERQAEGRGSGGRA